MLNELRETASVLIGDSVQAFEKAAASADVIFNWSGSLSLIRDVFLISPSVRWIHSRSAGLERTLFPELIASEVIMTNGSGVFSPSLGEFALAAILYFAKDFRRMIRNQMAARWEPFDVLPISGQTVGIVGYGDIGRGPVINERAMINALSHHKIKGAALDVFDEEPLPANHPFYKLENVLLSPHCADHTPDWLDNAMRFFLSQFEKFRRGEPLLNVVDKKLGY